MKETFETEVSNPSLNLDFKAYCSSKYRKQSVFWGSWGVALCFKVFDFKMGFVIGLVGLVHMNILKRRRLMSD